MNAKLLMACTLTVLSTGLVVACGDDGDDDGAPAAGKGGTAGSAGTNTGGKGGTTGGSSAGGKSGDAGSGGTTAGSSGSSGKGNGGKGGGGSGGMGTSGTSQGGESGEGGEAGGGVGGEGGIGGQGGDGGQSGEGGAGQGGGGAGDAPGGAGGQGGEAGLPGGSGGEGGGTPIIRATLRINEINPNIPGGADLIELRVIQPGTLSGITIEQTAGTPTTVATLPDLDVAANDLVVVHVTPTVAITDETTSKSQCAGALCYDDAWDVRGTTQGLALNTRVVSVRVGSVIQDAVPFVTDTNTPAGFPAELQAIQDAGHWLPTSCAGDDCTYTTDPTAQEVSVNWTDVETTRAGDSMQVTGNNNNNQGAWELLPSTWGEPNE